MNQTTQSAVLELLNSHGAVIQQTHVVYTSGRHGNAYINKDAIYPHTRAISELCRMLATHFNSVEIDVVAAPALGGIALSQWTTHHLNTATHEVVAVYAEKGVDETFEFRRGYDGLLANRRVLVVEDVLTTGTSLKSVIRAVRVHGGEIVGIGAICNRGKVTGPLVDFAGPIVSLCELELESWDMSDCPLCRRGVPINTSVGKGREFLLTRGHT